MLLRIVGAIQSGPSVTAEKPTETKKKLVREQKKKRQRTTENARRQNTIGVYTEERESERGKRKGKTRFCRQRKKKTAHFSFFSFDKDRRENRETGRIPKLIHRTVKNRQKKSFLVE